MKSRKQFSELAPNLVGKVLELSNTLHKVSLDPKLLELVQVRASQINGCAFCLDMHVKEAKILGERELRLHHVAIWRESHLFDARERAALEWAEAVTNVASSQVPDELYQRVAAVFSAQELTELTLLVNMINFWNRLCVAYRIEPGSADRAFGLDKAGLS